ncbi:MAG TPA: hypothetical protein PKL65_13425 [Bacteroidales bacterium]|jgi:hypothetical protein|nr:hypothetical protein [Bacteroidales bacterium]HNR43227.1 hypothetical protein [Bacteroidales bacterium]HPM19371.1 hypothetical protein [Bacteroidales bacterium]HQG78308.1 hypothetical protein [Bacteroidales bacterium]
MTLDNSKTIISLRIKLFAATVIFLAFIVLTYVAKKINYPLLGMTDTAWTVILASCYAFLMFLPMYLNYQYVYFSDEGENIVFRYFNAGIVGGRKNSVEINKKAFSGYQIEKKLFGLRTSIILYTQLKQGIAKYPPIHISALKRVEREKIMKILNAYAPRIKDGTEDDT